MEGVREINPTDSDGNSVRLYVLPDGLILPIFPGILERVEEWKTFIPKEDDVFLFGFPKSGTHWTWEIVNMLLRGKTDYMSYDKDEYMMEHCDLSVLETRPGPRVINSHLPFRYIPQGVLRGGNKVIHVVRNPKDAMVSYYNVVCNYKAWGYNGTWSAFLDMVYKGQLTWLDEGGDWFDYEKEWEQAKDKYPDVPILYVYYEDLHKYPLSTVKAISEFLGVECSQGFCEEVIDRCSFNSMKAARKPFEGEEERWRNGEQKVFLNGKIGTWKKWFTVQQNEEFKNLYAKKLQMSPFESKYAYP